MFLIEVRIATRSLRIGGKITTMMRIGAAVASCCLAAAGAAFAIGPSDRDKPPTTAQVMESAQPSDWRRPDPANTLYLDLPGGRVIIELAPRFAPQHVANIKTLVAREVLRRPRRRARAGQLRRAMGRRRQDAAHRGRAAQAAGRDRHRRGASACRSSNYPTRMATRPRPAGSTASPWASSANLPDRCG